MPGDLDFDVRLDPEDGGAQPPELPRASGRGPLLAAAAVVAVALIGVAAYFLLRAPAVEPPDAAAAASAAEPAAEPRRGLEPLVDELPALDASDALVRRLVAMFSKHPRLATWFATDNIIRAFAAIVANVAEGESPVPHLQRLRPVGPFRVVTRGDASSIDPRSFERYTIITEVATSIDPVGAARVYVTLKPLIDEAYADLGYPEPSFDRVLERAVARMLDTPVPTEPVAVEAEGGTAFRFARPEFEELSPAEKQLIRFGPANQRRLQNHIRAIASAIGLSAARGQ